MGFEPRVTRNRHQSAGFTLIEAAVVVGLVGLIASLAVASLGSMRRRVDIQSTMGEFTAALAGAQSHALSTGGYTWVIIYQTFGTGNTAAAGGYYLYDDPNANFQLASFTSDSTGTPSFTPESGDRILDSVLFGRSPYNSHVQVGLGTGGAFTLNSPFSGTAAACSFCSDDGNGMRRGAIVFQGTGEVRFYQGDGTPAAMANPFGIVTLASSPIVSSSSSTSTRGAVAISPVSGFIRVTKP